MLALFLSDPNSFRLARFDVDPLILRDKAQNLEHQIADEAADKVIRTAAGVQKRHIQHDDLNFLPFC